MTSILGQMKWESLKKRRKDSRFILLYKCHAFLVSFLNILYAQILWPILMNINSYRTGNTHLGNDISCETQLTTVINDWAKILDKKGQVDTFILDCEKALYTPPREFLKSKLFSYGIGGTTFELDKCFPWLQATMGSSESC